MGNDSLKKCLAWQELIKSGEVRFRRSFEPLISAGIARLHGYTVVLQEPEELSAIIDAQCAGVIKARDEALKAAHLLGMDINISSSPEQALTLLRCLKKISEDNADPLHVQALSARLFDDSKHIQRTPVLKRIFVEWSRGRYLRGELRLKTGVDIFHKPGGLNLRLTSEALGQVCIPANKAGRVGDFELGRIDFVLTTENLAPFFELRLEKGVVIFCPGYATALPGLWLENMPESCTWVHFGDFDPDGLFIFEQLSRRCMRKGRFIPEISQLEKIKDDLPGWQGARGFEPEKYELDSSKELARWGEKNKVFAEQEQVLRILGQQGLLC
ncbi:MAG: Wadjet anti-phage system protein JetD domain-containing protein [Desulfonatronovibrio sp.]